MNKKSYHTNKFPAGVHGPGSVVEHLGPDLWWLYRLGTWNLLRLFGAESFGQIIHGRRDQRRLIFRFFRFLPVDRMQLIRICTYWRL